REKRLPVLPRVLDRRQHPEVAFGVEHDPLLTRTVHVESQPPRPQGQHDSLLRSMFIRGVCNVNRTCDHFIDFPALPDGAPRFLRIFTPGPATATASISDAGRTGPGAALR